MTSEDTELSPSPSPSPSPSASHLITLSSDLSPVSAVTVYPGEIAEVTRTVRIDSFTSGSHDIILSDLPNQLQPETIRISVTHQQITVVEVFSEIKVVQEEKQDKKIREIDSRLKEIRQKKELLNAQESAFRQNNTWFQQYSSSVAENNHCYRSTNLPATHETGKNDSETRTDLKTVEENRPLLTVEKAKRFLDTYLQKLEHFDTQYFKIAEQLKELNKEEGLLSQKLADLQPKSKYYRTIKISLLISENIEETSELYVKYLISNCVSWEPSYDVRVDTTQKNLVLTYHGLVKNSTEENWERISLSLSTTSPSLNAEPPELKQPLIVTPSYRYDDRPRSNTNTINNTGSGNLFKKGKGEAPSGQAQQSNPSIFQIQRKCSIPSDKQQHKVVISNIELQSTFFYTAVPSMTKECFLRSLSVNSSAYVLLKGKLSIFIDNNFITTSSLDVNVYPSDPLFLSLGVDPAVTLSLISKEATKLSSGVTTMFGKRQQIETTQKLFCVENHHSYPIHLFLFDALPIALDSNFVVKLIAPADIPDPSTPQELTNLPSSSGTPPVYSPVSSAPPSYSSSRGEKEKSKIPSNESSNSLFTTTTPGGDEEGSGRVGLIAPPPIKDKETMAMSYNYVNKTDQVIRWNISLASMGSAKIKFEYTVQSNEGIRVASYTQALPASIFDVFF